jgi:hypothetical protein
MDQNDDTSLPPPTFSGNHMPLNVTLIDEDKFGEETTRRVGAFTPMNPTLTLDYTAPVPLSLAPPSFGSSIATAPSKSLHRIGPCGWDLTEAPVLPEFHPLERTAVFCPHSDARTVASRVSAVLKERSIHAEYVGAEAECLTADNVEFSVFLYRGKEQFKHGIICEVQRLNGNSINFHDETLAVLNAAENKESHEPFPKKFKMIPLVEDEDDYEVSSSLLDFVRKTLDGGEDSQRLGLETLVIMTDPSKVGSKTAMTACRNLMESGNEVTGTVINKLINEPSLALQVMIILSNVASTTQQSLLLNDSVIKTLLIKNLRSPNAQIAYLAAKCLTKDDVDTELADALMVAQKLGSEKHDGLYERTSELLQQER